MTRTILIIDDNTNALKLLADFLLGQGFQALMATHGQEALTMMEETQPDLILLDVMMPTMNGYQFISRVRRNNSVPIIMLTAKRQESDVVRGFELGADDYIIKPYRMRELLMRVRAVLRRTGKQNTAESGLTIGHFTLNKQAFLATVRGKAVELTPVEFHLLAALVDSAELPIHRAALSTHLIEHGFSGSENTLKIHIRNLRQKIEPDPLDPIYIETVFGIGYRLRTHE